MRPINRDRRKYIGYIGYIYIYIRGQILPLHYIRYFLYTLTADILLAGSELPLVKHKVYIIHTVGIEWWGKILPVSMTLKNAQNSWKKSA